MVNLPTTALRPLTLVGALLIGCGGCSFDESNFTDRAFNDRALEQSLDNVRHRGTDESLTHFTSLRAGLEPSDELALDMAEPSFATSDEVTQPPSVPFPERSNPFEFGIGVDFDAPQSRQTENLSIQLFGFIGSESPKAILNVGGKTKVLAAGEKWGVLEVMEVTPPTVRIKANGVARVWSLLGHHAQTGM